MAHRPLARLVFVALIVALAFPTMSVPAALAAPASAPLPAPAAQPQPAGDAAPSLANYLLPDGHLSPAASSAGSLNARGYRLASAPGEAPRFAPVNAPLAAAGDENWDTGFMTSGMESGGSVYVIAFSPDGTMYVGGDFLTMGGLTVNRLTRWNGSHWEALGAGLNTGYVYALAFAGDKLYVGGTFTTADGVSASNIALYDPATSTWSAVGSGTNGAVRALVLGLDGHLKVGGDFTTAGGSGAKHVADLDPTAGTWSALGEGLNSNVYALAFWKDALYAGGSFTNNGDSTCASCSRIAHWDPAASGGQGDWVALSSGLNGQVNAFVGNADYLYVGGQFYGATGQPGSYVTSWDGSSWAAVGAGFDGWVYSLAFDSDGALLAAGDFSSSGSCTSCKHTARFNGTAWESLGTSTDGRVRAIAQWSGTIYAGGNFNSAGNVMAKGIARYADGAWHGYGTGPDAGVYALARAADGTVLLAGGVRSAGETSQSTAVRWNPATRAWTTLGTGTPNGAVWAVAVHGSDVYIGGTFSNITGCTNCHYVAHWDGTAWSGLGTGLGGDVCALAIDASGNVYAGGKFQKSYDSTATFNYVARWDGTQWNSLGAGVYNGYMPNVYALAIDGSGKLWVGGTFTNVNGNGAGTVASKNIAVWDPSAGGGNGAWSAVTPGTMDVVNTILPVGTDIYVGGVFSMLADSSCPDCNLVAVLRGGTTWEPLGTGLGGTNGDVRSLAVDASGTLYAGGNFSNDGASTCADCQKVAKFEGGSWQGVGSGMDNIVYSLLSAGDLYVGGVFTQAGGHLSPYFARYDLPFNEAPSIDTLPSTIATDEGASVQAGGLAFSDPDAGSGVLQLTLSAGHGVLAVSDTQPGGVTAGDITGNASAQVTVSGTLAALNATLGAVDGLTYQPDQDWSGIDTISVVLNDQGNTGSGGAQSDTDSFSVTVNPIDDAPAVTLPGTIATDEDTSVQAGGFAFSDPDAGSGELLLTLSAGHGVLAVSDTQPGGVTAGDITGNVSAQVTVSGTLAALNATLGAVDGLTYQPDQDWSGIDTISVVLNDQGNTGSGGPLSDSDSFAVSVSAVNDAPVVTVPLAEQSATAVQPLVFSSGNSNAITVSDVDGGGAALAVELVATGGTLTLNDSTGLTFEQGDGANDSGMVYTATPADANTALDGLSFTPLPGYMGQASITITATETVGSGDLLSSSATVTVDVKGAPVAFTTVTPHRGTVGTAYSYQFQANGNPAPTYSLGSGDLPDGVILSPDGRLTGIPTTPGTYTFTLKATNLLGEIESETIELVIAPNLSYRLFLPSLAVAQP